MQYRRFGRTELRMPVVTCGGMRYQYKWEDVPLKDIPADDQANLEACVRKAVSLGINHIETARGYGSSERQLGQVLPTLPRDEIIVQTKICPEEDPGNFVKNFHESLERLKLDHVDLLGLHGINAPEVLEWAIGKRGCLAAARQLQAEGKCRHVGFSTHGPTEVILDAIRHNGDGGFDYVNLHWFYIQQWHWPAVEEATQRDMGVFIISPVDKGGRLYEPSDKMVDLCKPLHPIVFNDLFTLSASQVHTVSIGARKPEDYDLHAEAAGKLDQADDLLPPVLQRLEAAYAEAVEPLLRDPWALGLPDWRDTPGQINIPIVLWLRNLAAAYDLVGFGKMRYNLMGSGGHWFPGNHAGKLTEVESEMRSALAGHPLADRIPSLLREADDLFKAEPVKRLQRED